MTFDFYNIGKVAGAQGRPEEDKGESAATPIPGDVRGRMEAVGAHVGHSAATVADTKAARLRDAVFATGEFSPEAIAQAEEAKAARARAKAEG